MEKEKILPKEQFEKKENRKGNLIAILIGIAGIAVMAVLFWVLRTEKEETIPTNNNGDAMVYTGAILTPGKEYVGKCTVEISGNWIYKNLVSDAIKGIEYGIKVKDSDVEDIMVDIQDTNITFSGDMDEKELFDSFTTVLQKWDESGQNVQHIATMGVYDNFDKIVIRYTDANYILVAPAANEEEALAILEYENQKLLEQLNK